MAFAERFAEEPFLSTPTNEHEYYQWFHPAFGITEINPCWLIQLNNLLSSWRDELRKKGCLLEKKFDINTCSIHPEKIVYQDIIAKKIIFCD
ncbi:hypothetical protein ABTH35_20030, partial [Acinetobacter baumannii]